MKESKISILLHPIRMKLIQALLAGRRLTVQQITEFMPDVPPATMYRHLNKLLEAELIAVVEEKQVRGTVEKVYSLSEHANQQTSEEILNASREDQVKYFFTYLINLLGEFEKYINQENYDLLKDGVGYSQALIYADDNEFAELAKTLANTIMQATQNKPGQGRKARTLGTIIIPQVDNLHK
ncbi:MAG: helix-turn-helix domain-containing protein [Clostridiaceae bacterium]